MGMTLLLTACQKQPEPLEEKQELLPIGEPTAEVEEVKEPPKPSEPAGTNPLTGLPIVPDCENDRPIAVMFNNLKQAQPQLGISQADIIYEVPAEGGITRMLGLFQSLDGVDNLGSIRSARTYYLELALGHDAILVHAGGSPDAYKKISAWKVDHMDGVRGGDDAKIFWRDKERKKRAGYEHSLLTSGEQIRQFLSGGRCRLEHEGNAPLIQNFSENGTPIDGAPAHTITLKFSPYKTGTFTYDPESSLYFASQYGSPYVDGNSDVQPGFTNVLVLETAIHTIAGDDQGRLAVKLDGEGSGTFFCGGSAQPIRWSKSDRNHPFIYTTETGEPLTLGKGKSYICIVSPKSSTLSYE